MLQRMKHTLHGFTHAYSQSEIDTLEASGWVKEIENVVKQEPAKGKPGRKPKNHNLGGNNGNSPNSGNQ